MRSGVRPLPPTLEIFLNYSLFILYPTDYEAYHLPSMFNHQISRMPNPTPIHWKSMMHPSQLSTLDHESQHWIKAYWAQTCYGHPPQLLAYQAQFFLFLSIFFFIYLILVNLFSHTNLILFNKNS